VRIVDMEDTAFKIYSYFISKIYGREFFDLHPSDRHKKTLSWFLFPDITKEYIYDYCLFQFHYMMSKSPRYKEQRIPFGTIFGKKGIERYKEKKDGYMHYAEIAMETYGIDRNDILFEPEKLRLSTELIEQEEKEKARFFNTVSGFAHCLVTTSLFHGRSVHCLRCNYSGKCKAFMKKNFFPIFVDRKL
jgi:hypothetical protein